MNYIFRSKFGSEGYELKIGLWRFCEQIENLGYECGDIICKGSACSKLYSARAFVILACIMSAISALLLFACAAISDNTRRILLMAGKGLAFVSLIMGIIGVALGINFCMEAISETKLNWGASAIIGIIAIVVNFCGAITSVLIK